MKPTQIAENIKNKNKMPIKSNQKPKTKNKNRNRNSAKKNQTWTISFANSKILLDVPLWVRIVRVFKKRFRS